MNELVSLFDPALKLLEILTIIGGVIMAIIRMGQNSRNVENTLSRQNEILESQSEQIVDLKVETKKIAEVMTLLAVNNSRVDRLEADVRELRHGKGMVLP